MFEYSRRFKKKLYSNGNFVSFVRRFALVPEVITTNVSQQRVLSETDK